MEVFFENSQAKILKQTGIILLLLCLIGIIMVYSSSYIYSRELIGDSAYFFKKHLFFLFLGSGLAFGASKIPFEKFCKGAYALHLFGFLLLLLTLIPGLGFETKGSSRWLNLGLGTLQPGEFVKISFMMTSLMYFTSFNRMELRERIVKGLVLISPLLLLLAQPDFGTFAICSVTALFCAFLSSFPRFYFYSLLVSGLVAFSGLILAAPYRVQRLMTFLDPWEDPKNSGFQIIQSFLAFANGSIFGKGIGNSNEKLFYLPEAHNDFIFSVVGEELGFVGVVFIVLLFLAFMYTGFKIAFRTQRQIAGYFLATFVFVVSLQAFLNMGVVLGLLPTKGLNLPFISYGGSALLANFLGIGLCLSALKSQAGIDRSYNPISRKFEGISSLEKKF